MKLTGTIIEIPPDGHIVIQDEKGVQHYIGCTIKLNELLLGRVVSSFVLPRSVARGYTKNPNGEYKLLSFLELIGKDASMFEITFKSNKTDELFTVAIIHPVFNDNIIGENFDIEGLTAVYKGRKVLPPLEQNENKLYTKCLVTNHIYKNKYTCQLPDGSKAFVKIEGGIPIKFIGTYYYIWLQRKYFLKNINVGPELITYPIKKYFLSNINGNHNFCKNYDKFNLKDQKEEVIVTDFNISQYNIGKVITAQVTRNYYINPNTIRYQGKDSNFNQLIYINNNGHNIIDSDTYYNCIFKGKDGELFNAEFSSNENILNKMGDYLSFDRIPTFLLVKLNDLLGEEFKLTAILNSKTVVFTKDDDISRPLIVNTGIFSLDNILVGKTFKIRVTDFLKSDLILDVE